MWLWRQYGNNAELQKNWLDIVIVSPPIANANILDIHLIFPCPQRGHMEPEGAYIHLNSFLIFLPWSVVFPNYHICILQGLWYCFCLLPTKQSGLAFFCDISCILISEVGSNHSRGFPAGSGKARVASHSKVSCARFLQGISVPPASSEESTHTLLRMLSFGAGLECWHWFDKDQHVQAHQKHCVAHLTHTNVSSLNCENDDNEETLEDYVTAVQTKQTSTMK